MKAARARPVYLTRRSEAAPPPGTRAESFYYAKQIESAQPLVAVLTSGGKLTGRLVAFDRRSLGFVLLDGRELRLGKQSLRYLYKPDRQRAARGARRRGF